MELIDFVRAVRQRRRMVVIGVLSTFLAAVAVTLLLPEEYEARATLIVDHPVNSLGPRWVRSNPRIIQSFVSTYEPIVKSRKALRRAVEKFAFSEEHDDFTWQTLEERVRVEAVPESQIIYVKVELKDRKRAQEVTNFIAEQAVERQVNAEGMWRNYLIARDLEWTLRARAWEAEVLRFLKLGKKVVSSDEQTGSLLLGVIPASSLLDGQIENIEKDIAGLRGKLSEILADGPGFHESLRLKLVDRAQIPHWPSGPNRALIVGGATLCSLVFLIFLAACLHFLAEQEEDFGR